MTQEERYEKVMQIPPNKRYSLKDSAELIGCSLRQLYLMMADGRVKYEPSTPKCKHRKIIGRHVRECYLNN